MSNDNKTLADVQPGGRVRLPDQAERARFEAFLSGNPLIALSAGMAWQVWQAALSAQPSPGGQDALDCIGRIEEAIEFRVPHDIYAAVHGELAELKAALAARQPVVVDLPESLHDRVEALREVAARQPVGKPVGEKLMRLLRERAALPESVELSYQRDGDGTGRAWWDRRHAELEAKGYSLDFETDSGAEWYTLRGIGDELRAALAEYDAAPPAQAVGKPVAYLDLGAGGYMDVGTDLSDEELAVLPKGRHMLGIIGTYGVDGYKPAQAVDLDALRRLSDGWLARSEKLSVTQQRKAGAYWACAKELRDWLDSQAVGNG